MGKPFATGRRVEVGEGLEYECGWKSAKKQQLIGGNADIVQVVGDAIPEPFRAAM